MNSRPILPRISRSLLALFSRYAAWYLGRHFHALRLLKSAPPPNESAEPLVVFLNHAAWWDPLVCLFLRDELSLGRSAYAPMEASALERYGFLKRLGFFPVEEGTRRGARQFLETADAVLERESSALFMTPQGKFADVRAPLVFASGLEHLTARHPRAKFLPLAIEYSYWEERKPEVLIAFGEARTASPGDPLTARLAQLQAELASAAVVRQRNEWQVLQRTRSGVNLPYDLWRKLRARGRGEDFHLEHGRL